jgi:hypothetical protein
LTVVLWLCLASSAAAQVIVPDVKVGYIDSAIVANQFRLRYESGWGTFPPDRAEFFYPKCGCFRDNRLRDALGDLFDPNAPGPLGLGPQGPVETNVDHQEVSLYLEQTASDWFSGFVEIPNRFINPELNPNSSGLGDIQAGGKALLWWSEDTWLTFQLRTYIPTGEADKGLGTDHVSLEPALLVYHQLSERLTLEGELRDWIPIGGTDFAGNVIRYGMGVGYTVLDQPSGFRVAPITELVGWTVVDGKKLPAPGPPVDAAGDTIVNLKLGARVFLDPRNQHQLYFGYGRALTGEHWYEEVVRAQYQVYY